MKSTAFAITLIIISSVFVGCKPQQYTVQNLPEKQLRFGNGGGFTGAATTYILLENGQLFQSNSLTKETKELKSLSQRKATDFFEKGFHKKVMDIEFNHPGNTYFFIEAINATKAHKITWGNPEKTVPQHISAFYYELIESIK